MTPSPPLLAVALTEANSGLVLALVGLGFVLWAMTFHRR